MRFPYLLVLGALAACGTSERTDGLEDEAKKGDGDQPGSIGGNNGDNTGNFGDAAVGPGTTASDCSDAAKLVYVVSAQNDLYSFKPDTLVFTKIGRLSCTAEFGATPYSMAVDRSGTAWVDYSDGTLYKVSTKDAHCEKTTFKPPTAGFTQMGMGFVSDAAGASAETLYVSGNVTSIPASTRGLGKLDVASLTLTPLGDYSGSLKGQPAEFTGTGDGRLFGFFTTSPATLAAIDKATGATSDLKQLTGVDTGKAWAFSFWGGDFWFYTASNGPSRVHRLRTSGDNSLTVVLQDVGGFSIVGAGVSTCAPTKPPGVN